MAETRQLIEQILAGDTHAFRSLIDDYQRLVSHIVFRMVSNESDREDVCQDVFVKVYQNLSKFQFEAKLSTWIARIAYNTCINYLKKKKVPLFEDHLKEEISIEETITDTSAPDDFAVEEDLSARLKYEINKLPPQFRAIISLYHLDEMRYTEIAEIMDLPEGTVKSYLFRARKLLKERLMSKYRQEELCR